MLKVKKLSLLFSTVRHLRFQQVAYQVIYRLSKVKPLLAYSDGAFSGQTKALTFSDYLLAQACATPDGRFSFLNKEVDFQTGIDWAFSDYGKLWNYNLHYGHYLLQEEIPLATRLQWLADLHANLKSNAVMLEPYPVSIRIMNTIRLVCRHNVQDKDLLAALQAEVSFLSGRIEYHLLANHVLENAFALFMGGAFFDHDEWRKAGYRVLDAQLKVQILNDGGHYELSPMYHQVILYRLLELIDWYQAYDKREEAFLDNVRCRATLMLGWLRNMTFSTNEIPYLNDSAPSIAYDTKSLLDYAAFLKLNTAARSVLSDSGYRKYTRGNYECVVDVANIGPTYQAGHGHADALAFILYYKGNPVFVEAGTSTYEADAVRAYERSTEAHNTVSIHNTSQSEVWGSFRVGERAHVTMLAEGEDELAAEHDGYLSRFSAKHRRSILFDTASIVITDTITGRKNVKAVALFHLHPSIACRVENNQVYLDEIGIIKFLNPIRIERATYSFASGFNVRIPATVFRVSFEDELKTQIAFT